MKTIQKFLILLVLSVMSETMSSNLRYEIYRIKEVFWIERSNVQTWYVHKY